MNSFRIFKLMLIAATLGSMTSCHTATQPLKEGAWRGVFQLDADEIPFNFEVSGSGNEPASVYLVNGEDRFQLKNIVYRADSVFIPVDLYETVLNAKVTGNVISGRFFRLNVEKTDTGVPFVAKAGLSPRFASTGEQPAASLNGTWDIAIGSGDKIRNTVGNFKQQETLLTGSILTPTGDYRFLEGTVQGKKFSLSTFAGSTPYLVKGEFLSDSLFIGELVTPRSKSILHGKRNTGAALPDAYTVTYLKEGFKSLDFSFPNLEGRQVSLSDEIYRGKVVVVTILGSWCPNCLDENAFLSEWYTKNRSRGVEIIGLGFEHRNNFESAKRTLTYLKTRLNIGYEILFAGQSGKENASKALPQLNGIASFPTTIFIDKKGNVRKIHSGFNGPATGRFYEEFKAEFKGITDQLLAE